MDLNSGYPYWLIKNGLPYDYPKLNGHLQTDVVIIGGGITGALCAYELSLAGIECIVVDGRTIGLGSTCASTSLLQYELDKPLHELSEQIGKKNAERSYKLCSEAIDELEIISKTVGCSEYESKKSLFYAAFKKDSVCLSKEYKARRNAGFNVELMNSDEILSNYGFSAPAAILSHQGACVNAYMLTHKLHQFNIAQNSRVYDRTFIQKIAYAKMGVTLYTNENHQIKAKKIINASGYEIKHFIDKKIVTLQSTYALASENIQQTSSFWKDNAMIWNTANPYLYMRIASDNRIIMGGRDEPFYNPARRDQLLKMKTRQLTSDFKKLFPHINMKPEFSWTGTFGITKDSLPYIGDYAKYPHTYFALGFGGNGITFSVIASRLIARALKGKYQKDLNLFDFSR